jgi:type II secretory pathway pseudopilin PulG
MRTPARRTPGFTVVEILVVLGIVIGVISTVIVGLNAAASRARTANTEFLMNSIVSAISRFRSETGYLPLPLGDPQLIGSTVGTAYGPSGGPPTDCGWARDGLRFASLDVLADGSPNYGAWGARSRTLQLTGSVTALPEFLLGPGDRSQDGYGVIRPGGVLPTVTNTPGYREQPVLGIRNPGQDGLWGAYTNPRPGELPSGVFRSRNLAPIAGAGASGGSQGVADGNGPGDLEPEAAWSLQKRQAKFNPFLKGKSLGPYLEVKSDGEIGALVGFERNSKLPQFGTPLVAKPGEVGNFDAYPKVLLDYFGNPIVYYRRGWLNNDPRTTDQSWSLADIVALRPARFGSGEDFDAMPDAAGDGGASRAARAAEFALLSFGPDRRWNPQVRADPEGFNEDNLVRFGP